MTVEEGKGVKDDSKVLDLSNFIFKLISFGHFIHETKQFIHYLPQHFLQKKHMLLPSTERGNKFCGGRPRFHLKQGSFRDLTEIQVEMPGRKLYI